MAERQESLKPAPFPVYVISGGVGATGEQLARTVLAQFSDSRASIEIFPKILSWDEAEKILTKAVQERPSCSILSLILI